jgi:hypothetical protein
VRSGSTEHRCAVRRERGVELRVVRGVGRCVVRYDERVGQVSERRIDAVEGRRRAGARGGRGAVCASEEVRFGSAEEHGHAGFVVRLRGRVGACPELGAGFSPALDPPDSVSAQ